MGIWKEWENGVVYGEVIMNGELAMNIKSSGKDFYLEMGMCLFNRITNMSIPKVNLGLKSFNLKIRFAMLIV